MSNLNINQFQWAVVGDTNPVGCQKLCFWNYAKTRVTMAIHCTAQSMEYMDQIVDSKNVLMSFGHDGNQIMLNFVALIFEKIS